MDLDKNRVVFLLGAGCPLSIRDENGIPLIPDIAGLTENAWRELDGEKTVMANNPYCLPD